MGLDQYAYKIKKGIVKSQVPNPADVKDADIEEIAYWRKHPNLEGWMRNRFEEKGGEGIFNCKLIKLTIEDLSHLKFDILHNALPSTTGSFFGADADEYYEADTLEFIYKSISLIEEGYDILYYSWW